MIAIENLPCRKFRLERLRQPLPSFGISSQGEQRRHRFGGMSARARQLGQGNVDWKSVLSRCYSRAQFTRAQYGTIAFFRLALTGVCHCSEGLGSTLTGNIFPSVKLADSIGKHRDGLVPSLLCYLDLCQRNFGICPSSGITDFSGKFAHAVECCRRSAFVAAIERNSAAFQLGAGLR